MFPEPTSHRPVDHKKHASGSQRRGHKVSVVANRPMLNTLLLQTTDLPGCSEAIVIGANGRYTGEYIRLRQNDVVAVLLKGEEA